MAKYFIDNVYPIPKDNIEIVDYAKIHGYDNFELFCEPEIPKAFIGFSVKEGLAVYDKELIKNELRNRGLSIKDLAEKYKNNDRAPLIINVSEIE